VRAAPLDLPRPGPGRAAAALPELLLARALPRLPLSTSAPAELPEDAVAAPEAGDAVRSSGAGFVAAVVLPSLRACRALPLQARARPTSVRRGVGAGSAALVEHPPARPCHPRGLQLHVARPAPRHVSCTASFACPRTAKMHQPCPPPHRESLTWRWREGWRQRQRRTAACTSGTRVRCYRIWSAPLLVHPMSVAAFLLSCACFERVACSTHIKC